MNMYKYLMEESKASLCAAADVLVVLISGFWIQILKTDLDF